MRVGPVQHARNGWVRSAHRTLAEPDAPPPVSVPGWFSNVDWFDDPANAYRAVAEPIAASTSYTVWD